MPHQVRLRLTLSGGEALGVAEMQPQMQDSDAVSEAYLCAHPISRLKPPCVIPHQSGHG